jgi:hypothetical protein
VEQFSQVTFAGTREVAFVCDIRVELVRRRPEHAERPSGACVVPNARCDDASVTGDSAHLAKSLDGIGHEVDDQLCQGGIESPIPEGKLLCRCLA